MLVTADAAELLTVLGAMGTRAKDSREAMSRATAFLIEQTRQSIASSGPGWAELADTTITHRGKGGSSATSPLQNVAPYIVGTSTAGSAEVTIMGAYMPIHLTGRGKLPKRDPFEFFDDEGTLDRIADIVTEHVIS
jgi:hypothetical protein